MKTKHFFFLCLSLLFSTNSLAAPAQVVIIRHAEKPPQGNQVTAQGCERAYSLAHFFTTNSDLHTATAPIAAVYAQQPNSADSSIRAIQTIAPTAQSLGLQIQDPYTRDDYVKLAQDILNEPLYNGKTVLIAWEHKVIPDMAMAFGLPSHQTPSKWPGVVFDQVWILKFDSQKNSVSLQIIPEFVLPTDNPQGGSNWDSGPQQIASTSPVVSSDIVNECLNNDALNSLARGLTTPALPALIN